jgi:hypothetical protein
MCHYLSSSAVLVLVVMLPIQPLAGLLSGSAADAGGCVCGGSSLFPTDVN